MRWSCSVCLIAFVGLLGCGGGSPGDPPPDPPTADPGPDENVPLVLTIGDSVSVGWLGAPAAHLYPLPLDESIMRSALVQPLYDLAKPVVEPSKRWREPGGPYFGARAEIHIAPDSPITGLDLLRIFWTLAQAYRAELWLWLGDDGPLRSGPPRAGWCVAEPLEPSIVSALVLLHQDVNEAWVSAAATWGESEKAGSLCPGYRPRLVVPLVSDAGCALLPSGPPRDLAALIDARLRAFGLRPPLSLTVALTPQMAFTDEFRLALDLQGRGWGILLKGSQGNSALDSCPDAVHSAEELALSRARFLAQTPNVGRPGEGLIFL